MNCSRFVLLFLFLFLVPVVRGADPAVEGTHPAPEFPADVEWLNTDKPLSIAGLKGKVVLLDFWTYCCINCMHVIPDLKKLEAKYPKELVVIGVHSAKFSNEKDTENIRQAIKRYEIEHPVINDKDFKVWRLYGARSWPTLILVNPLGKIIGGHSGENVFDLFDSIIGETVKHFDASSQIDRRPVELTLERRRGPRSLFAFPGKIVADQKTGRIFFSDSNNHRVIVATVDGFILDAIGQDEPGFKDGDYGNARFFRPQGLAFDAENERLYVADTENHAIRLLDLKRKKVETLAGVGTQARRHNVEGPGRFTALNSPWDLVQIGDTLYIAMAGPHQIWTLNLKTLEARVYAGSSRENLTDGPLKEAALAQPSGITTDGRRLYFADSEASALRAAELGPTGRVETLIGKGLFEFGDIDGKLPEARLQHCLGATFHEGAVYVADTYNHKIKRFDLENRTLTTFVGSGRRGGLDGNQASAQLNEPNGLCFVKGKMLIADSNNHLIRSCDLKSGEVTTLIFKGVDRLRQRITNSFAEERVLMKRLQIAPTCSKVGFSVVLPAKTKLNPLAPSLVRATSADNRVIKVSATNQTLALTSIDLPITPASGQTIVTLNVELYYCAQGNEGLCYFKTASLTVPIEISPNGSVSPTLEYHPKE